MLMIHSGVLVVVVLATFGIGFFAGVHATGLVLRRMKKERGGKLTL